MTQIDTTYSRPILLFILLMLPALGFARMGEPGLPGDPIHPDSLAKMTSEGHLFCKIYADTNCVTRQVSLEAWIEYTFTGINQPVTVPWSTGLTAHKIFVTPPGTWSWDVTGIGCEPVHQFNTITFNSPFMAGPLDISGPSYICPAEQKELIVSTNGYANWSSFTWSTGYNGFSPYLINQPGIYALTVSDAFGCPFTDQVSVPLLPAATAGFTASINNQTVSFNNTSTNATSYAWNFGNGQTSTQANPTITYANPGTYNACLTATNTCGSTSTCQSISIQGTIPPPWIVETTGRNHTMILPANLNTNVQGVALQAGDYIGAFFESSGTLKCGGYGIWSGTGSATAFAVYGNDAVAPAKNGFNTGEAFKFKIWHASAAFDASAEYAPVGSLGGIITHTNTFADDGISMINALTTAVSYPIASGWNMISSYVLPGAPNMLNVFSPIASHIDLVKDDNGISYIPVIALNNIGNWNLLKGYQVKANAKDTLLVVGQKAVPETTPIPLHTGWQIINYLRDSPQNATTVFAPIQGQISLVKDNAGHIYTTQFGGINTIGDMKPGQGYKVNALSNATLVYQANFADPIDERNGNALLSAPTHFVLDSNLNTGNNATIVLTDAIADSVLDAGDEIGVFTTAGVLCGASKYAGESLAVTVWGDDTTTGNILEGMEEGETYHFMVWDSTEQQEYTAFTTLESGIYTYTPDAIEEIQQMVLCAPTGISLTVTACDGYMLNNQLYSTSGTYTQTLTNAAGCDSTITLQLIINPSPLVVVNSQTICAGQEATLTASGANSFLWSTGATTNSITVTPTSTTTYTVMGTLAGCSASASASVTVNALPVVSLGADIHLPEGQTHLLDATCTCQTYQWSTGETSSVILVNAMGTYTVTVTNDAGCSAADTIVVTLITSANNPLERIQLSVSPNPTNDLVWITCHGGATSGVQITDPLGQVLLEDHSYVSDGAKRTLSLKKIPAGIYYVRIAGDGFIRTISVLKQ